MASSEEYRRHAGECVRLAQQIQNAKDKAMLLAMAETWLRLWRSKQRAATKKSPSDTRACNFVKTPHAPICSANSRFHLVELSGCA
jgi:hypothetical protein